MSFLSGGTYVGSTSQLAPSVITSTSITISVRNMQIIDDISLGSDVASVAMTGISDTTSWNRLQLIGFAKCDANAPALTVTFKDSVPANFAWNNYDINQSVGGVNRTANAAIEAVHVGDLATDGGPKLYFVMDLFRMTGTATWSGAYHAYNKRAEISYGSLFSAGQADVDSLLIAPATDNLDEDCRFILRGLDWEGFS